MDLEAVSGVSATQRLCPLHFLDMRDVPALRPRYAPLFILRFQRAESEYRQVLTQVLLCFQFATALQGTAMLYAPNYEPSLWRTLAIAWTEMLVIGGITSLSFSRAPWFWKAFSASLTVDAYYVAEAYCSHRDRYSFSSCRHWLARFWRTYRVRQKRLVSMCADNSVEMRSKSSRATSTLQGGIPKVWCI